MKPTGLRLHLPELSEAQHTWLERYIAEQRIEELTQLRRGGTYFKRQIGFAPGLWLKVDLLDKHIATLKKEVEGK